MLQYYCKDVNKKELFELKHDIEDLKEANQNLWKCLTEAIKKLYK